MTHEDVTLSDMVFNILFVILELRIASVDIASARGAAYRLVPGLTRGGGGGRTHPPAPVILTESSFFASNRIRLRAMYHLKRPLETIQGL